MNDENVITKILLKNVITIFLGLLLLFAFSNISEYKPNRTDADVFKCKKLGISC